MKMTSCFTTFHTYPDIPADASCMNGRAREESPVKRGVNKKSTQSQHKVYTKSTKSLHKVYTKSTQRKSIGKNHSTLNQKLSHCECHTYKYSHHTHIHHIAMHIAYLHIVFCIYITATRIENQGD